MDDEVTRHPRKCPIGVTSEGGDVVGIDPTENVLALVDTQSRHQRRMDAANSRYFDSQNMWTIKYFQALADAEQRRVDGLAAQKKDYDNKIGETQTGQMKTTSDLVSTQLDKVTTSLSDTINKTADNITAALAMMNERLAKVEQFRYETGGKTSMTDPAMAGVLADIAALKISKERTTGHGEAVTAATIAEALTLQKKTVEHGGTQNNIAVISVAVALVIAVVSFAVAFIKQPSPIIDYGSMSMVPHSQKQLFMPSQSYTLMYRIRGDHQQ